MSTRSLEYLLPNLDALSLSTPSFFDNWVRNNGFIHDSTDSPTVEFDRLAEHMRWDKASKGYRRRQQEFFTWNNKPPPTPISSSPIMSTTADARRDYFDDFRLSGFVHNPTAHLATEFKRLAKSQGWKRGTKEYRNQQSRCFAEEFETHYGNKTERLDGWQRLCSEVHIDPVPQSITKCRKALDKVWVNIVDLIDCRRTGKPVFLHSSRNALRKYSVKEGKIFSLGRAKSNGFLTALLIRMF